MKKFLSLALVLILVLATLASCNFGKKSEETTTQAPQKEETPAYDINSAVAYLENLYKDGFKANPKTAVDYDVVAQVMINGLTYKVTWTVDTDKVIVGEAKDGKVTINVDEKSPVEVKYNLTATVTAADNSATKAVTFKDLIVPLYGLLSWDEYMAAAKDDVIPEVRGVVTGIVSKSVGASYNCLFLQDATGGAYYIYGMPEGCDPIADLNIEIGMTVSVAGGIKDIYNGTHEIKPNNGALQVTILSTEKTPVTPMDYTEIFKNAADLKATDLVKYQSSLVTLKGVTIADQVLANGYLNFELAGKTAYLRISGSTLAFPKADKDAFIAEHAAKSGYTADVTGIISLYNGAFYLVPVSTDAFNYLEAPDTPEAKLNAALVKVNGLIGSSYSANTEITLPTGDASVTLTWASNNNAAVIANGKLQITIPAEETTIVITVTATCEGAEAKSKEFTVTLLSNVPAPDSTLTISEALALGATKDHNTYTDGKYYVTGVITEVYNTQYGNMKITDADGNILTIYGTYDADGTNRYDAMTIQPVAGDTVTVYGIIGQYNDTPQVKNGWITAHVAAGGNTPEGGDNNTEGGDNNTEGGDDNTDAPEEDEVVDGTKVTVTIGDYATANSWADATKYLTITMDENITVTATGGGNTGKYYNNGKNWRIYQSENPTVTIAAANGKTIKTVKITYASQNTGVLTMNGNNVANEAVVEVNAASVTFSVGNTGTADNGQARITAIEVIYA